MTIEKSTWLKIEHVGHWMCDTNDPMLLSLLERMKASSDNYVIVTGDELIALFDAGYDVMLTHCKMMQPTNKAIRMGKAKPVPDQNGIWLDESGGRFRQR